MPVWKTREEQLKLDGKTAEETNIGWLVHGKDTAIEIRVRWNNIHGKPEIQLTEKKSNKVDITLHFRDIFSEKPGREGLSVYKVVVKSPYEEEPGEIRIEEDRYRNFRDIFDQPPSEFRGELSSEKTGMTVELLGEQVKVSEEKLVPHSTRTDVLREGHDRLITAEVSYDFSQTKVTFTYKVEEDGKLRIHPRGSKIPVSATINSVSRAALVEAGIPVMIREGASEGEPKVLVEETVDINSKVKMMAEFLKQPGVNERIEKIAKENRQDQGRAAELGEKGWCIKQD
ncbi:MAG: hypothetical protein NT130_03955 [Candidatus Micrarchaeota archaeon]|nr:hypothetical protein [Candidatus Micrarchaeota archaeon]